MSEQVELSEIDPKQSLNCPFLKPQLAKAVVKMYVTKSAVVGLQEVQILITLEVVKQMSVLRSRQSWPTKPSGPFIVQNVHPYLRKTQNQLQINLGTDFAPLPFCAPIS